ncbi:zinc finger protein [Fusarium mundagurra]|uniref:Zinc finger protein n=1 Tax=Fusarium mundagurra TaxID=1567541 RepID=A0A8H5Y4N3_9HYPO|nr:zinc finger protein [Fusarium mundagurra]
MVRGRWMHLSAAANPRSDRNDVRDYHAHAVRMKSVPALRSRAVRSEAHRYIRGSVVACLIPRSCRIAFGPAFRLPRRLTARTERTPTRDALLIGAHECVPTGFGRLHNHFQFQSPADIHGDALKQKLDQTRSLGTPRPQSLLRSSTNELLAGSPFAEGQFPPVRRVPVQLPIRPQDVLGSPARLSDTSTHSAISPRSTPFFHVDKSPNDSSDIGLSSRTVMNGDSSDDATSTHLSYDFTVDMEVEDEQSLKRPHVDDSYALGGQKRKATSPNDEHLLPMPSDTSRQRDLSSRGCPQGRFTSLPRVATMPPVHTSRSKSYISTMSISVHPAGLATANSFGRQLNQIPRTSTSGCKLILSQTISDASTRTVTEVKKPGRTRMQSFYC